jgi:hypothetical protein
MRDRTGWLVLLAMLLAACATSKSSPHPSKDSRRADGAGYPDIPVYSDFRPWPDHRPSDRRVDGRPVDRARDHLAPDSSKTCPDVNEPNESCAAATAAGSAAEGSGWVNLTATLDPGSDQDWFSAKGLEGSHFCLPGSSQCYTFAVQVAVPTGRVFQVCLLKDNCAGTPSCVNNVSSPGPKTLSAQYKVDGTCALTDDAAALIQVKPADGKGGCTPYTFSFRYDPC